MTNKAYLVNNARTWVRRKKWPDEVVRIVRDQESKDAAICYQLFTAYEASQDYLGQSTAITGQ